MADPHVVPIPLQLKDVQDIQNITNQKVLALDPQGKVVSIPTNLFDQDNIKTQILIDFPPAPSVEMFADVINQLPTFIINSQSILTFKSISTGLNPATYYIELIGIGKGTYGVGGVDILPENLKITSHSSSSTDIAGISSTQIIDLGYQGDDIVTSLNRQLPNIDIQDQNDGYVIITGVFQSGEYHEYLWLGVAGSYGNGGLQSIPENFKELSAVSSGIARATTEYSGTVKTNTIQPDPIVYVKETVDTLLGTKADLVGGKVPSTQLPSYVDDILEYANYAALPVTGETGKIYVTLDDNKQYRWSGSIYVVFAGGGGGTYKTYYVNTVTGSNPTGEYQNPEKPFATIDYVLTLPAFKSGDIIWLQDDDGIFPFNGQIPANTSFSIKSDVRVILDISANNNARICVDNTGDSKTLTIDMPLGIIKNDRGGVGGVAFTESNGRIKTAVNVFEIYWNVSNTFGEVYSLSVSKISSACSVYGGLFANYGDGAADTVSVSEFVCLSGTSFGFFFRNITLSKITGSGYLIFSGDKTNYNVGDVDTTGKCRVGFGANAYGALNFLNSVITSSDGLELGEYPGSVTYSGTIKSVVKLNTIYVDGVSHDIYFKNFIANIGLGTIHCEANDVVFENCSIKSTNSPVTIGGVAGGVVILKNSTFEVVNSAPLCSGGLGIGKTIKVSGVSTNATMISDQEDTGVTVIQDGIIGKNLKLSNYPNTRNDGALPSNKILSTDVNGNLKLYTMAVMPAPFLEILIPDSTSPSTTTNFVLRGAFFTPTMTVVIAGQTINYLTFVSDNEVRVNVTTSAVEGFYAVTLNNGIEVVFLNALLIVLGDVFSPVEAEWTNIVPPINIREYGNAKIGIWDSVQSAKWVKVLDYTQNFSIRWNVAASPYGANIQSGGIQQISIRKVSDGSEVFGFRVVQEYGNVQNYLTSSTDGYLSLLNSDEISYWNNINTRNWEFRWYNGVLYGYLNNVLKVTSALTLTENMNIVVNLKRFDITNIKYIELAS